MSTDRKPTSTRAMAKEMQTPESTARRYLKVARAHPDVGDEQRAALVAMDEQPRVGLDQKTYRPHPLTEAERAALIIKVHGYRHNEGLSIRETRVALWAEHKERVSVGAISRYLRITEWGDGILTQRMRCAQCSGAQGGAPEQEEGRPK
jgi:hypothetical protein